MNKIKNTKNRIRATIIACFLTPIPSKCAALPERSDISIFKQEELNNELMMADYHCVVDALRKGADPNSSSTLSYEVQHKSVLQRAIEGNSNDITRQLINAGANFEAPISHSPTSLHWICHKLLSSYWYVPSPPFIATISIDSPLSLIVTQLIDAGADLNAQNKTGNSPLSAVIPHIARLNKSKLYTHYDIIHKLIHAHADLDIQNNNGDTALMRAIKFNTPDIVQKLIRAGADETLQDNTGRDIIHYATHNANMLHVVQEALKGRAYITQIDEKNLLRYEDKKPIAKKLQKAHAYLVHGPLSIDALGLIFLSYITAHPDVLIAQQNANQARKTQRDRAERTCRKAIEWQTAQQTRREAAQQAQEAQKIQEAQKKAQREAERTCIIA
jgi:ankyrin repeat protein